MNIIINWNGIHVWKKKLKKSILKSSCVSTKIPKQLQVLMQGVRVVGDRSWYNIENSEYCIQFFWFRFPKMRISFLCINFICVDLHVYVQRQAHNFKIIQRIAISHSMHKECSCKLFNIICSIIRSRNFI